MSKKKLQFLNETAPYGFDQSRIDHVYKEFIRLQCTYQEDHQVHDFENGRVFYTLKFNRLEDKIPRFLSYDARLRAVPPIQHGVFSGIDTRKIEQELYATNWLHNHADNFSLPEESLRAFKRLWAIMEGLIKSGEKEAIDVVQQLQVKHWAGTLVENYACMDLMTVRYDTYYDFSLNKDYRNLTAENAYNLLSGRPVLINDPIGINGNQGYWLQLERSPAPDRFRTLVSVHYPEYDLNLVLDRLKGQEHVLIKDQDTVLAMLKAGKPVKALQSSAGSINPVLLIAQPANQAVRIEHPAQQFSLANNSRKEVGPVNRKRRL